MYLTVPLPPKTKKEQKLTLLRADPTQAPRKLQVTLDSKKDSTVADLKQQLCAMFTGEGLDPERLVLADVMSSRIYKQFLDTESCNAIKANDDVYAIECVDLTQPPPAVKAEEEAAPTMATACGVMNLRYVTLVQRKEVQQTWTKTTRLEKFGTPRVFLVDDQTTTAALHKAIGAIAAGFEGVTDPAKPSGEEGELAAPAYRVAVTDTYCYDAGKDFPCDEATVQESVQKSQNLSVDWSVAVAASLKTYPVETHESLEVRGATGVQGGIPLRQCIESFTNREQLDADNEVYCSNCKEHRQSSKKLDIWTLPQVLIIALKRFQGMGFISKKIDTVVDFPDELDMAPYCVNAELTRTKYRLFAVSNHSGGMGGGHYYTYAKGGVGSAEERKWFEYNDSSVTGPMDEKRVRTGAAYVLFYERIEEV